MIRLGRKASSSNNDENPYWISFSDIMAGLLVIFILAALQLILQLTEQTETIDEAIRQIEKANEIRTELLISVKEELENQGIIVEISDNSSVLRIPSTTLNFESDQAALQVEQQQRAELIGIALLNAITFEDRAEYIDTIFIEGHTDSRLSFYKGIGNWLLSADRAITIWRFWSDLDSTRTLSELKNRENELMFSVSGYAETRLVEIEDDTPEKQEANRRIDLRFTMRQPTVREYQEATNITL